jgi:hypothetical protein
MSDIPLPPTFTEEDLGIVALLDHEPEDWTRRCFDAAFIHLSLAHCLKDIDPAMALFRAITAEEEAATGLLRALQVQGYAAPGELLPKDHLQKAAVYPYLRAIAKHTSYLRMNGIKEVRFGIPRDEDKPKLQLALLLDGTYDGLVARPIPPLNLRVREGGEAVNYQKYFRELISPGGFEDIRKYLNAKKNQRNLLLYASPEGLLNPGPVSNSTLLDYKIRIMTILTTALLIWPYKENQPFVQEAVRSFLELAGRLRKVADVPQG